MVGWSTVVGFALLACCALSLGWRAVSSNFQFFSVIQHAFDGRLLRWVYKKTSFWSISDKTGFCHFFL